MNKKFLRQDVHKKKKLKLAWRRPKGLQSKLRLGKKGYGKKVSSGYNNKNAKKFILVENLNDLLNLKEKNILISSKIGLKKKIELLKKAKELKINVLNLKSGIDNFLKDVENKIITKKEAKIKKEKEKEMKKKELESKKTIESKLDEKDNKETDKDNKEKKVKEEKNKVLTKSR